METIENLNDETVDALRDLVRLNIDSANGFRTAAADVNDAELRSFFDNQSLERDQYAKSIATYLKIDAADAPDSGTIRGKLHQWWLDARSALQSGDRSVILDEAVRGEKAIKEQYEQALKDTAGSPVNDVLQRQYASIKGSHDQIERMRQSAA